MFWNNFPYTNVHNLNLDWIIKSIKMLFNSAIFSINGYTPDADGNIQLTGTELGAVGTVNGKSPDSNGNVEVGTVRTINNQTPDAAGAIEVGKVRTVNGFAPDAQGEVKAGTIRSVNGKSPTSVPTPGSITLTASDVHAIPDTVDPVESVNGLSPDANGNVNVGTVKSVNSTLPDANGNVNLPTVAGVTSVDGIGPDGNGDVPLGAVTEINSITPVSGVVTLTSGDVGALSKTMVTPTYTISDTFADPDHRYADIRSIGGFLYIRFDITLISALAYGDVLISGMPATVGQLTVKAWAGSTPYNINLSSDSSLKGNSSIPSGTTIVGWAVKPLSNPS